MHSNFLSTLSIFICFQILILFGLTLNSFGADILVTTLEDIAPPSNGEDMSLRQAIFEANRGDNILIPTGTYTLTLGRSLRITKDIQLRGLGVGPEEVIIEAATVPHVASSRVFDVLRVHPVIRP